ncbi:MAG: glycosyltransferase, partial [Planctomycetota bacterium]
MRILMLGWECPPFIAGGLGTACHGLTSALDRIGQDVVFVLPKGVDGWTGGRVRVIGSDAAADRASSPSDDPAGGSETALSSPDAPDAAFSVVEGSMQGFERTRFVGVPAAIASPYAAVGTKADQTGPAGAASGSAAASAAASLDHAGVAQVNTSGAGSADYTGDMRRDCEVYANMLVRLAAAERFDVIHAHDWMTFPAGMAVSRLCSRPMVAHVHSTEFDRSGENVNQQIYDIERRGMHAAVRVIAVSRLTKSICVERYGISPDKIDVVYNGVAREDQQPAPGARIESDDKIVLFLGRITMQKGP